MDISNINPFSLKYPDNCWNQCPSKKCVKYYLRKTKDKIASISITFHYIDDYYEKKKTQAVYPIKIKQIIQENCCADTKS